MNGPLSLQRSGGLRSSSRSVDFADPTDSSVDILPDMSKSLHQSSDSNHSAGSHSTHSNYSSGAATESHEFIKLSSWLSKIRFIVWVVLPMHLLALFVLNPTDYSVLPDILKPDSMGPLNNNMKFSSAALQPEMIGKEQAAQQQQQGKKLRGLFQSRTTKNLAMMKEPNETIVFDYFHYNKTAVTSHRPLSHAIFYNIFIPASSVGQANALRIVREQVDQIKNSYAARRKVNVAVFYVTLGADHVLTPSIMKRYCGLKLDCHHVQHFATGSEMVTLEHMHDFCSRPEHEDSHITYLHNKGSFHYNEVNENWRPILTDAALSEMCLKTGFQQNSCNLCGLQFYTTWTPFIPGNMFSAKCEYVKKLIKPQHFSERLGQAISQVVTLRLKGQLVTNLLPDRKDFFGLERYSDEHWIASHPDVTPCDCDPKGDMARFHFERHSLNDLAFSMAPRISGPPSYKILSQISKVIGKEEFRYREYYHLPGNLVKWFALYNKAPGPHSWAWTWFHDGPMWKNAVEKHGSQAVDIITKKYASDLILPEPTFSENDTGLSPVVQVKHNGSTSAVFFDMVVPNNLSGEQLEAEVANIKAQLETVKENSPASTVFYTTMGNPVVNQIGSQWCNGKDALKCVHLKHFEYQHRGETSRQIQEYCRHNPTHRIAYVQNSLSTKYGDDVNRIRLMQHVTKAVTNPLCLATALEQNKGQCNVCGLTFHTIPSLRMSGDSWAASCSYVNQLLPPQEFVERMEQVVSKSLIQKIWTRLNFGIVEDRLDNLGLGGYSMDHWIGSHPSLMPCDLSDDHPTVWARGEQTRSRFSLHNGAHMKGTPYARDNSAELEKKILSDERMRVREFSFLAGNLLKWYTLYGSAPQPTSWVWKFFPDGDQWLSGVVKYGNKVVETLTSNYELTEQEMDQLWEKERQRTRQI